MDWDTQPDPFRRFDGAPLLPLDLAPPTTDGGEPRYEPAFVEGGVAAAPLDRAAIGRLFQDSLALSAWKQAGTARWSLRVNPSSGNLHPTEGYLVAGPIPGLSERPAVYHYAPHEHALELRFALSTDGWRSLAVADGAVLVGFASIHWRESWKYGERAFRYCHHDAGHAVAALAIAAAGLGWRARLLEGVLDQDLAVLLGLHEQRGPEAEHADCLVLLAPEPISIEKQRGFAIPRALVDELRQARWSGMPNRLSPEQHLWPEIDEVAAATEKRAPPADAFWETAPFDNGSLVIGDSPLALRPILHQRRSAVALDGRTGITRGAFYQILLKTLPGRAQVPFAALPWQARIDLLLFVHRVDGIPSGLYVLLRDPAREPDLRAAFSDGFVWARPEGCPSSLPLHLLEAGDARKVAAQTSCGQEIAADGAFACAMLADYRRPIEEIGAWFYRRLHWEAGAIGQVLYLEAEASGIRGTGIGCFFDDATHLAFGLRGDRYQVLYHFTMGGPVDDPRLQTRPPYEHLSR
ncbi:MAG: SagB/ThcOx family dehydrogenase [Myxococcales bacterium]|nr:SagB/ThcOx family dehydrogenase [Myxococcales bacterium]